jgi:hypothetical protein
MLGVYDRSSWQITCKYNQQMHWVPFVIGNNNSTVFLPIIRSFSALQRHWYSLCSSVTECYRILVALGHRATQTVPVPLYGWETPDDEQKDCPKHVELLLPIKIGTQCICWLYLQGIPRKYFWYSVLLEAESTPGPGIMSGNRTRDFPACSAVRQPTAPPRALFGNK